jgi:hypothetical protein
MKMTALQTTGNEIATEQFSAIEAFGGAEAFCTMLLHNTLAALPTEREYPFSIGGTTLTRHLDARAFFASIPRSAFLDFLFLNGIALDRVAPIDWRGKQQLRERLIQDFLARGAEVKPLDGSLPTAEEAACLEPIFTDHFTCMDALEAVCAPEQPLPADKLRRLAELRQKYRQMTLGSHSEDARIM